MASLAGVWQAVQIIRPDGRRVADIRPLVRLNVVDRGRRGRPHGDRLLRGWRPTSPTTATSIRSNGGRRSTRRYARPSSISARCRRRPGEMTVVLGPGWPGVMLHEAVGHGLEGDFNRKKTSAFSGMIGQRVATKGVTVVDDGTLPDRRGSLTVDDEGTPDKLHRPDRGRHSQGLHAGPHERAPARCRPDRKRP